MTKHLRLDFVHPLLAVLLLVSCVEQSSGAEPELTTRDVSEAIDTYRQSREKQILNDFVDLLSLPNDSMNPADMDRNVDFITAMLERRGFTYRTLSAGRAPYIYAELKQPGATETVLLYAHFDGQPVQAENWAYPPFTPTLLDAPLPVGKPVDIDAVDGRFGPEWRLYARSAGSKPTCYCFATARCTSPGAPSSYSVCGAAPPWTSPRLARLVLSTPATTETGRPIPS